MPMETTRIIAITNTFVGTAVEEMNRYHISRIDQIKALACLRSAKFLDTHHKPDHDELIKTVQIALIDTEIMDYLEPLHRSHLKAFPGAESSQATHILNQFNDQLIKAIDDIAKIEILDIQSSDRCVALKEQEIKKIEVLTELARNATPYTVTNLTLARKLHLKRMILCANIFSVVVALLLSGALFCTINPGSQSQNSDFNSSINNSIGPLGLLIFTFIASFCLTERLTKGLLVTLHHCILAEAAIPNRSHLHQFNLLRFPTKEEDISMRLREISIKPHSEQEETEIITIETPLLNPRERERTNHP